jgi:hypothetical protein
MLFSATTNSVSPVQPENAFELISETLLGIINFLMLTQSEKALSPIPVTVKLFNVPGISTISSVPL